MIKAARSISGKLKRLSVFGLTFDSRESRIGLDQLIVEFVPSLTEKVTFRPFDKFSYSLLDVPDVRLFVSKRQPENYIALL